MQYADYVVKGVQQLQPYQPGKPIDEVARELNLNPDEIVKLASNENPLGASPKALAAIQKEFAQLNIYPDGSGFKLKAALANKLGVQPEQLTLGNGSSDILDFITRVLVQDGDDVVVSQHAFSIYGLLAQSLNAHVIEVPAKNYGHDLDAMSATITEKTRIVFVTNPNNPTGTWVDKQSLNQFLQNVPKRVIVVVDEAYFEYVDKADYPNAIELLEYYPNLLVTRTFSKAYGLASLRVGYGISSPELADLLNRVRPPFNVDSFALAAATAVLDDKDYLQQSLSVNQQGMLFLCDHLAKLGLTYIDSVANFISFALPSYINADNAFHKLLAKGVIVRPLGNYQMPQHLRVTIGTQSQNVQFIQALQAVLNEAKEI